MMRNHSIFINYNVFMDQLKRFESKISSEFRKRAKLVIFWLFGENGNFFAKAKKALISLVFRTPTRFLIQIFLIGPEKH